MCPDRNRSESLRLFVAAYPPRDTAGVLLETLRRLDLPEHRLVGAEQVHLTLQFIGDTPATQLDATIETVRHATGGIEAFELTPRRLVALPGRGPARLVAAEADSPAALLELHRRLVTRLAHRVRRDRKRFRPHLTLLRFRSPSAAADVDAPLDAGTGELTFRVDRVRVMRSTLRPEGAFHEEVAEVGLEA